MSTMNESSSNIMREWAKVAGVTLSVPQMSYTIEYEPDKIAELRRYGWRQWERHRWTLILHENDSKQPEPKQEISGNGCASFALNEFQWDLEPTNISRLRELLVDFCLFDNCHALISPGSSASKKSIAFAPELKKDLQQLADYLHKQLALAGGYHLAAQCDSCQKAVRENIEVLDTLWTKTKGKQGRSHWASLELLNKDCIHAEPARKALDKLCRKYPSIIFELCGLIAPVVPTFSEGSDSKVQENLPTRFILDKERALAMADRWLRAVRTDQTEPGDYRYGFLSSRRRYYSSSVRVSIPRAKDGEGGMPAKLREAVMFSALGYKIDQEAEALVMGELAEKATVPLKCPFNALPVSTLIVLPDGRALASTDTAAGDQARILNTAAKAAKPKNKQKLATATKQRNRKGRKAIMP